MKAKIAFGLAMFLSACIADGEEAEMDDGAGAEPGEADLAPPAGARANIPMILFDDNFDGSSPGEWVEDGTQDGVRSELTQRASAVASVTTRRAG